MNDTTMQSRTGHVATDDKQTGATLLSGATITGDDVCNMKDENLGKIQDIMIDVEEGEIRYVVLATGGFMGMGDRLFAIPWKALQHDTANRRFLLDVEVDRLKKAPGFDKDQWPDMADPTWNSTVETFYTR